MMWVPADLMREIENIRQENNIQGRSEAMRQLAKLSEVGRQVRRDAQNSLLLRIPAPDFSPEHLFGIPQRRKERKDGS